MFSQNDEETCPQRCNQFYVSREAEKLPSSECKPFSTTSNLLKITLGDFPGDAVDKNLPANATDPEFNKKNNNKNNKFLFFQRGEIYFR